ncbi:MAG: DUF4167 domain-containing protein [Neomegalonema sp.]|nr:DUF4167 domain-containing protein [Neomegalonema sp.]
MRPQQKNNNRARSKTNRNKSSGQSLNRVYESSGPEGKVRGTPQQIVEKYQALARDKATAGDRILAESYQQHAEHYARIILSVQQAQQGEKVQRRDENENAEPPRRNQAAEGLEVIDGRSDEASAEPESITHNGAGSGDNARSEDEREEEAPKRRTRRPRRRETSRSDDAAGGEQQVSAERGASDDAKERNGFAHHNEEAPTPREQAAQSDHQADAAPQSAPSQPSEAASDPRGAGQGAGDPDQWGQTPLGAAAD